MKYRKLFDWIDSDDACEATAVTLHSAHDPSHDGEGDFIISRVKSLIETGVTVRDIVLTVWLNNDVFGSQDHYLMGIPSDSLHDVDAIADAINRVYDSGQSIETMVIKVDIKEDSY